MSIVWEPERESVRLRSGTVTVKGTTTVSLTMDGATVNNVPVYGTPPAVGSKVIVLEQGGSLLVIVRGA